MVPSSLDFVTVLNDATRMLMRRGNWWGTVKRMNGCIYDQCLTWPRQVGTPLALKRCGTSIPLRNYWYDFDQVSVEDVRSYNQNGGFLSDYMGVAGNTSPVFNPLPCGTARWLRFYPSQPSDDGKIITLFGSDANGQPLRSHRTDGTYQDGWLLALKRPFVQTTDKVLHLTHVTKAPTAGSVTGLQWDGSNSWPLCYYAAGETRPEYRTTKLSVPVCGTGSTPMLVSSLVKLAFIPVVYDDDLVGIENIDALALAIQAIKRCDAYDEARSVVDMTLAVRELNAELRDKYPIDQTPVRFSPFGSARLERARVGMQ